MAIIHVMEEERWGFEPADYTSRYGFNIEASDQDIARWKQAQRDFERMHREIGQAVEAQRPEGVDR